MVSMSGKQLRVQYIFPEYDDSLSFVDNGVGTSETEYYESTLIQVVDDSDFVPELAYPNIALDFDDSSISVRFLTTAGRTPSDFNGFGILDVDGEIGDFLVEDVQIVSGSVPRGMGLDDSVSPVEGSDVFLWNFVKDRTVRSDASLEAEFVI